MWKSMAAFCLCAVSLVSPPLFCDDASISITSMPPYGKGGVVTGVVSGVDPEAHKVANYIYIDGAGWWIKPTVDPPTVPIDLNDGTFKWTLVGVGLDPFAFIICAALISDDVTPPVALGSWRIPRDLEYIAIDCKKRYGPTLEFAGYTWAVKGAPAPVGPGGNRFSLRPEDVFVENGQLHLTIKFYDSYWWSTEVILLDSLGYGTYTFQTNSRVDVLNANATFGAFTWDSFGDDDSVPVCDDDSKSGYCHREIDFEDGRWGNSLDTKNAQMAVQSWDWPGNRHRYTLPDLNGDTALTRCFSWASDRIEFLALRGHHSHCDPLRMDGGDEDVIDKWVYTAGNDHYVPARGRETFHFNLWLNKSSPASGQPVEVVITDFTFTPDTDGDGIPDLFEDAQVCLNSKVPDATLDPDGDSVISVQEYKDARNPCVNEAAVLMIINSILLEE